jgi:hypothetical protein
MRQESGKAVIQRGKAKKKRMQRIAVMSCIYFYLNNLAINLWKTPKAKLLFFWLTGELSLEEARRGFAGLPDGTQSAPHTNPEDQYAGAVMA